MRALGTTVLVHEQESDVRLTGCYLPAWHSRQRLLDPCAMHTMLCGFQDTQSRDAETLTARFEAAILLRHLKEAWDSALLLKSPQLWEVLGKAAVHALDIAFAIRQAFQLMFSEGCSDALLGRRLLVIACVYKTCLCATASCH